MEEISGGVPLAQPYGLERLPAKRRPTGRSAVGNMPWGMSLRAPLRRGGWRASSARSTSDASCADQEPVRPTTDRFPMVLVSTHRRTASIFSHVGVGRSVKRKMVDASEKSPGCGRGRAGHHTSDSSVEFGPSRAFGSVAIGSGVTTWVVSPGTQRESAPTTFGWGEPAGEGCDGPQEAVGRKGNICGVDREVPNCAPFAGL